jgi:hypothetical protein
LITYFSIFISVTDLSFKITWKYLRSTIGRHVFWKYNFSRCIFKTDIPKFIYKYYYFWTIFWNTSNIFLFFHTNCRTQEYDNQCCYDDSGILMNPQTLLGSGYANRYHYAGDNLDNIPFLSNFIYDILPYQHCCVHPLQDLDTSVTRCDVFYARRPPNSCLNYLPPVVGKLWRKSSNSDVDKKRTPISDLKPPNTNMTTSYGVGNRGPGLCHGHTFSLLCSMFSMDSISTQFVCRYWLRIPI